MKTTLGDLERTVTVAQVYDWLEYWAKVTLEEVLTDDRELYEVQDDLSSALSELPQEFVEEMIR